MDVLSPSNGVIGKAFTAMGLEPIFFLGDSNWFPYTMVLTDTWKAFGYGTIVYLAALTGIDPSPVSYTHLDVYKRQLLYCNQAVISDIIGNACF